MQRAYNSVEQEPVSEMEIVDTFTKLVFEEGEEYSDRELQVIETFRVVDPNVMRDSHRDMGAYLRSLGVREMIHLVSRLREQMGDDAALEGTDNVVLQTGGKMQPRPAKRAP